MNDRIEPLYLAIDVSGDACIMPAAGTTIIKKFTLLEQSFRMQLKHEGGATFLATKVRTLFTVEDLEDACADLSEDCLTSAMKRDSVE